MQILKGEHIYLRALEPEDINFLYTVENNSDFWEVSNTETPFSKFILEQYLANAHLDIYSAKQLRLIIADIESNLPVGMVDLFDFNPKHHRAGVGILITKNNQKNGFATEALKLLKKYCFNTLALHQLFANISSDNKNSIRLFENADFKRIGIKKDWMHIKNSEYKDEILFQLIKNES